MTDDFNEGKMLLMERIFLSGQMQGEFSHELWIKVSGGVRPQPCPTIVRLSWT